MLLKALSTGLLVVLTGLILLTKGQFLFKVGGSLGFVPLVGLIYYISLIKKQLSAPLTIISLICWNLIAFNIIAHMELTTGLTSEIIIGSMILVVTLNSFVCLLIFHFLKKPDESSIEFWKQGTGLLYHRSFVVIVYIIGTIAVFWLNKDKNAIVEHRIMFLSIVFLLMVVFYIFSVSKLKKDRIVYRQSFTPSESIVEIKGVSKRFLGVTLGMLILWNLLVENIRGMWLFISLTSALFAIIFVYVWRFLENLLESSDSDIDKSEFNLNKMPSLSNPNFFLKTLVFHTVMGVIYMIFLGSIIHSLNE